MRENIKKTWKALMRLMLKMYTGNYGLFVSNYLSAKGGSEKHHSQFGQDLFALKLRTNGTEDKIFVDVGGNHPVNANNTYLLELNGWKGIAIEPQEKLRALWPLLRKTRCINCVIGPEEETVSFFEGLDDTAGLSGVEGFNKCDIGKYKKIQVQQRRLDSVLLENKITKVDYLSIDVEGYEMNVLNSIDLSKISVILIGIENDLGFNWLPLIGKQLGKEMGNNKIRKILADKGYKYIARIMSDDFFIKE